MDDRLNSLEGFDSGSNYRFGDKMIKNKNPRSLFDLSHLNTLTIKNAGYMIPIASIPTLPGDDMDISVDCLLRVLPQVVPLYSRQRLYVYAFWNRNSDLWNNWQVFMSKGYTGTVLKRIPSLKAGVNITTDDISNRTVLPNSYFDYLGLPIGTSFTSLFGDGTDSNFGARISALKYMQLLRIYRDYFMNKNEWIEDRVLLPDDDSRFRLDDDGQLLSAKDSNVNFYFSARTSTLDSGYNLLKSDSGSNYWFYGFFHEYPDDYFTSALPFAQRGNASKLTGTVDASGLSLNFNNSQLVESSVPTSQTGLFEIVSNANSESTPLHIGYDGTTVGNSVNDNFVTELNKGFVSSGTVSMEITLNDIRKLAIEQLELEQLARTDGSYRQFGLSFFGEVSKASYDYKPLYIGGTYKNITFTEVLQTSAPSTAETGNTPLGAYAGHGITGISNGRIGHLHSDDYGNLMILACIMPDIYYSQGLDKLDTDSLQTDMWLPERVKLGLRPIYNKELFYQGNNGNEKGEDNYLWAYQNPFDEYRYISNKIHGQIADSSKASFFPYTQSRKFNSLPNWGRDFSEAKNVRKDYLASSTEDAYTAQFSINIRAVRPLPYKAIPAEVIN